MARKQLLHIYKDKDDQESIEVHITVVRYIRNGIGLKGECMVCVVMYNASINNVIILCIMFYIVSELGK